MTDESQLEKLSRQRDAATAVVTKIRAMFSHAFSGPPIEKSLAKTWSLAMPLEVLRELLDLFPRTQRRTTMPDEFEDMTEEDEKALFKNLASKARDTLDLISGIQADVETCIKGGLLSSTKESIAWDAAHKLFKVRLQLMELAKFDREDF